ncbi:carboxymuconolactone decarboxylase family protein [Cytobacillus purgationiresistens]|uniref:AhpD family alkylhydroperoxidase n=1 Tax=Cytobacillus purgationiresistens TaxID=863449 RepID=A0ABU0ALB2_9BACI|nr:carboxymuconolactone decarboxylase family protein [Cytobacillus purgationiresistens]MDQ0272050.1 AhpD family alkylhydroperoxidase [Cytobacillus purgationiresistens]
MEFQSQSYAKESLIKYKEGLGLLAENLPSFTDKFNEFTQECFKEGTLSQKEKQLIALGISVQAQDEFCMIYHTKGCIDYGCTEQEILEAIGVAAAFGGGAAISQGATLVQDCIKEFNTLN